MNEISFHIYWCFEQENQQPKLSNRRLYAHALQRFVLRGKFDSAGTISFSVSRNEVMKNISEHDGLLTAVDGY